MNVDDYGQFSQTSVSWHSLGRWLQTWIYQFVLGGRFAPTLALFCGLVFHTLLITLSLRYVGLSRTAPAVMGALLMALLPYHLDMYNFGTAVLTYPLANLLAVVALLIADRRAGLLPSAFKRRRVAYPVAASLLLMGLAIYQPSVSVYTCTLMVGLVFLGLKHKQASLAYCFRRALAHAGVLLLAGFGYLALFVIQSQFLDTAMDTRSQQPETVGGVVVKLFSPLALALRSLLADEVLFPRPAKFLLLAGLVLSLVAFSALRQRLHMPLSRTLSVLLLWLAALVSPFLMAVSHSGDLPPRAITAYALVGAALIGAPLMIGSRAIRVLAYGAGALVVWIFALTGSSLVFLQQLTYQQDQAMAIQIVGRVDGLPGYDPQVHQRVSVVGVVESHYGQRQNSVLRSAFHAPWSQVEVLKFVAPERRFYRDLAFVPVAAEVLRDQPPWPAPGAVQLLEGRLVIKLSEPD